MFLNISQEELLKNHALATAREICQQPETWKKTVSQIKSIRPELTAFIQKVTSQPVYDVIFTGAGTSEFVGSSVFAYINHLVNFQAKSYGTTDILTSPSYFLSQEKPTLIVSFARSGNSPESKAVVELANAYCKNVYHLLITCNIEGALSKIGNTTPNAFAINLTPETHDESFVMTSSFSNMVLASLLAFDPNLENYVESTAVFGADLLSRFESIKNVVSEYNFERIIYLGASTLKGVAQESALKMLELTAGKVCTLFDTPLGFRHGPKSIINDQSLVVVYLNNECYARKYELDLIKEIARQRKGNKLMVVGANLQEVAEYADFTIELNNKTLPNCLLGLNDIIVAQLLAFYKALSFGITPDNPCPTGEVNRVVQGVVVYEYQKGGCQK